jgi:hypothetical protein
MHGEQEYRERRQEQDHRQVIAKGHGIDREEHRQPLSRGPLLVGVQGEETAATSAMCSE